MTIQQTTTTYKEITLVVPSNVYAPLEDSTMLADAVQHEAYGQVLDMGCGSGIQAITAAKKNEVLTVTAADFSTHAIRTAKANAKRNKVDKKIKFTQTNLFSKLKGKKFNTIIFNPPYLPVDEQDEGIEKFTRATWDGGKDGRKLLDPFLQKFDKHMQPNGVLLLVQSSLNNPKKTNQTLKQKGYTIKRVAHNKFFFEELYIIKATKRDKK